MGHEIGGPPRNRRALWSMTHALWAYHPQTGRHAARVDQRSLDLGRILQLNEDDLDDIHWAGLLHDIGKLGVPVSILDKPSSLDPSEWEVVLQHPTVGESMITALDGAHSSVAEAIRCHHERWNGSGYPNGLTSNEIPLSARIIAVADTYDAMTEVRPYRPARHSTADAARFIMSNRGSSLTRLWLTHSSRRRSIP